MRRRRSGSIARSVVPAGDYLGEPDKSWLNASAANRIIAELRELNHQQSLRIDALEQALSLHTEKPENSAESDPSLSEGIFIENEVREDSVTVETAATSLPEIAEAEDAETHEETTSWREEYLQRVKMDPGLSLRSTTLHQEPEILPESSQSSPLIVSSEKRVDWRDLLFSSARSAQGSGQSHFNFKAVGGGNELGGACYMLEAIRYDVRILIDAGIRFRGSNLLPDLAQVPKPDLIVITHSHLDHCGALPRAVSLWPDAEIWCHNASVPLIEHNLQLLCRQPSRDPLIDVPEADLYAQSEIDMVTLQGRECSIAYRIPDTDLTLTFWPAGHTLGACSLAIEGPEDSFFFTGEYASHNEPSVVAARWPEKRFDVVVASCSGIAGRSYDRLEMHRILVEKVNEILCSGGWAIFPVTESGKAQDLFLLLREAEQRGDLPPVPIYWDGAQRRLAMTYSLFSTAGEAESSVNYLQEPGVPLNDDLRAALPKGAGILLTNPGFLFSPAAGELLTRILKLPYSAVFTPVRPDSPLDLRGQFSSRDWDPLLVSYQWPAHPSEDEMTELLLTLQPQAVLLVHGTQEMQRNLRASLPAAIIRRSISTGETLRVRPQGVT